MCFAIVALAFRRSGHLFTLSIPSAEIQHAKVFSETTYIETGKRERGRKEGRKEEAQTAVYFTAVTLFLPTNCKGSKHNAAALPLLLVCLVPLTIPACRKMSSARDYMNTFLGFTFGFTVKNVGFS